MMATEIPAGGLDPWLRDEIVCPRDLQPLVEQGHTLVCAAGHRHPYVDGIPAVLLNDVAQAHWVAPYSREHLADEPAAVYAHARWVGP